MRRHEAMLEHREAYLVGAAEFDRTDSESKLCRCPYREGTPEHRAFWIGWNLHYNNDWDKPDWKPRA